MQTLNTFLDVLSVPLKLLVFMVVVPERHHHVALVRVRRLPRLYTLGLLLVVDNEKLEFFVY
jgi:hypothetical protein